VRPFLFFIVFVLCSCKYTPSPVIPGEQVNHSSHSTVALVTPTSFFAKEGEHWAFCTGSFVSQYEVLTANHCVTEIGDRIKVATYADYLATDGTFDGGKWTEFHVVKMFKEADLALLRIVKSEKSRLPNHTVIPLGDRAPRVGEQVYIVGHPNHAMWSYTIDIVSNSLRMVKKFGEPRKFFQHQTPVFEGNSGGPVISMYGGLVGVVSMYTPGVSQLNLSVHLDEIKKFLVRK
jgi:S1-C subfamily serine protease